MKTRVSVFWFRRDLRLEDNLGLSHALSGKYPVLPIFIFDRNILDRLEDKSDRRVDYIHQSLDLINSKLKLFNSSLKTYHGKPLDVFADLHQEFKIEGVFCNRDYEPYALKRDAEIHQFFTEKNIPFLSFKDQVIFEKDDVLKSDRTPYTVYTPYSKKWKLKLDLEDLKPNKQDNSNFYTQEFAEIHSLSEIGFDKTNLFFEPPKLDPSVIDQYDKFRDYPALKGTTQLGIALRFGTISIRKCVAYAKEHNEIWLNELIWREFFMQILCHFPKVVDRPFKAKYDFIEWRNNEEEFDLWCQGKTGYPIVDAGMRQLNKTGFMHNRVRMIAASFLLTSSMRHLFKFLSKNHLQTA